MIDVFPVAATVGPLIGDIEWTVYRVTSWLSWRWSARRSSFAMPSTGSAGIAKLERRRPVDPGAGRSSRARRRLPRPMPPRIRRRRGKPRGDG